jgi:hypothetical protein
LAKGELVTFYSIFQGQVDFSRVSEVAMALGAGMGGESQRESGVREAGRVLVESGRHKETLSELIGMPRV